MDVSIATDLPIDSNDSEDALMVLGRVADAFDNACSRESDGELGLGFAVNVVKTRQPRNSHSLARDEIVTTSHESPFDISFDEDVELEELDTRELASSYPPVSRRYRPPKPRSYSAKKFRQDNATRDVSKMLLRNSPLDRLDRLARMELKKTGWLERGGQWAVVEMGLQGLPTPPKPPAKSALMTDRVAVLSPFGISESSERSPQARNDQHKSPRTTRSTRRPEIRGAHSPTCSDGYCGNDNQRQGLSDKETTPSSIRSPSRSHHSQLSDPSLLDFSPLSFGDSTVATPIRTRLYIQPSAPQQIRGRFGQVVRNFVKRMLPPSSGSPPNCITRTRQGVNITVKDSHKGASSPGHGSPPRSDTSSAESRWSFASVGSVGNPSVRRCMDYQGTKRWSGLWH